MAGIPKKVSKTQFKAWLTYQHSILKESYNKAIVHMDENEYQVGFFSGQMYILGRLSSAMGIEIPDYEKLTTDDKLECQTRSYNFEYGHK